MIKEVFKRVTNTENANIILTKDIIGNSSVKKYEQVILVDTEVSLNDGVKSVKLYIALKEPYAVNLPKVFIDEYNYKELKYIPHINSDLSICVIDESENFSYSIEQLPEITIKLLERVKEIIRTKNDGIKLKAEFEREFSAYWDINYNEKSTYKEVGLCLIDFDAFQNLKAIRLSTKVGIYKYVVYNNEDLFVLFKNYLKKREIRYDEISVFVAEYTNVIPPFKISFKNSLSYLTHADEFRKNINKLILSNFIVVFKGKFNELFGWEYSALNKRKPGFRDKSNWQFLNSSFDKSKYVNRISFSNITPQRLDIRTAGLEVERDLKIAIIGLGSVGSNLLYYLMKYPISSYCLIDPDLLTTDNVFRHKYGFDYLMKYKTEISENEILSKNPFVKTFTYEEDVCSLLIKHKEVLNSYDIIFTALGITRLEKHIINHLISVKSSNPIVLIWVEPYLASGQMIYLLPEDFEKGIKLIDEYPYHVIDKNERIIEKEGSCQTGYMPYSDLNLGLFLSSINFYLHNILVSKKLNKSKIISWIGDIDFIKSKNIKLSKNYNSNVKFKTVEHEI